MVVGCLSPPVVRAQVERVLEAAPSVAALLSSYPSLVPTSFPPGSSAASDLESWRSRQSGLSSWAFSHCLAIHKPLSTVLCVYLSGGHGHGCDEVEDRVEAAGAAVPVDRLGDDCMNRTGRLSSVESRRSGGDDDDAEGSRLGGRGSKGQGGDKQPVTMARGRAAGGDGKQINAVSSPRFHLQVGRTERDYGPNNKERVAAIGCE
uniref:Uncharacterized protein n=1 Tax=Oryza meridionalis TaxID=40149 RepID=A0A0E0EB01_9ORYZ